MFQDSHCWERALGPALQAGFNLMVPIGGKIPVLFTSLPSVGTVNSTLKTTMTPRFLVPPSITVLQDVCNLMLAGPSFGGHLRPNVLLS